MDPGNENENKRPPRHPPGVSRHRGPDSLMRIDEVANFLRTSENYVRELIASNVLRITRLPNGQGKMTKKSRIRVYASSVFGLVGLSDLKKTVSDEDVEFREQLAQERLKRPPHREDVDS